MCWAAVWMGWANKAQHIEKTHTWEKGSTLLRSSAVSLFLVAKRCIG
jgi:hypothetical protein